MQGSEMMAGAGLCVFFIIIVGIVGTVLWRSRKLEHEERRLMIEKGMRPPDLPGDGDR